MPQQLTFPNEAEIDLTDYFLDPGVAQDEIDEFSDRFKRKVRSKLEPLNAQNASIVMSEFKRLYEDTEQAIAGKVQPKKYVTGIKVTIGVQKSINSKDVVLFFTPVYMKEKAGGPAGKFYADILPAMPGELPYVYNEVIEKFTKPDEEDFKDSTKFYHQYMRVKRYKNNNRHYQPAPETDWRGDTKSMVFSFKELFELYHDSYKDEDPNWYYGLQIAAISASMFVEAPSGSTLEDRYKHSLVFSVLPLVVVAPYIKSSDVLNNDDLANLAHLCPPATNCSTIIYPL